MRLSKIPWYATADYWWRIEPLVGRALACGGMVALPVDIFKGLVSREMQLWLALDGETIKGFGITRLDQYPRLKVLSLLIVGGVGMKQWQHFIADLESEARSLGCDALEGTGRKGWERVGEKLGYRPVTTLYRKML